jgi:four helix bundle protein
MKKEFKLPFEKLEVWQDARKYINAIYGLCKRFPEKEKYGLTSQLQRAAVSIAANIAEGTSRTSPKDQAHFTQIAYGSLMETSCLLIIAEDLGFINPEEQIQTRQEIDRLANKLNALRKYQLSRSS